jgi:hypothetical protein
VHGSYIDRAISDRAVDVHSALLEHAPYLDEPRFIPAVDWYLKAAARESFATRLHHVSVRREGTRRGAKPHMGTGDGSVTIIGEVGQRSWA